jgi:hypothetical protein
MSDGEGLAAAAVAQNKSMRKQRPHALLLAPVLMLGVASAALLAAPSALAQNYGFGGNGNRGGNSLNFGGSGGGPGQPGQQGTNTATGSGAGGGGGGGSGGTSVVRAAPQLQVLVLAGQAAAVVHTATRLPGPIAPCQV